MRHLVNRRLVATGSWFVGIVVLLGGIFSGQAQWGQLPDRYLALVGALGTPWAILPCAMAVYYKEIPRRGMSSITGNVAVIEGILGVLVFGGLEIIMLYGLVRDLIAR